MPAAKGHVAGGQPRLLQAQLLQGCIQEQEPEGCLACTAGQNWLRKPRGAVCTSLPADTGSTPPSFGLHVTQAASKSFAVAHMQTVSAPGCPSSTDGHLAAK